MLNAPRSFIIVSQGVGNVVDDFGSGSYLARTGQLGYSRPGANTMAGNSHQFAEGFPVLATLPIAGQLFGKHSQHPFSTAKWEKERGIDSLFDFKSNQPLGIFSSPWQQSKFAQNLKTLQDMLKSTATTEQITGRAVSKATGHDSDEREGIGR